MIIVDEDGELNQLTTEKVLNKIHENVQGNFGKMLHANSDRTMMVFRTETNIFVYDICKTEYKVLKTLEIGENFPEVPPFIDMVINWRDYQILALSEGGTLFSKSFNSEESYSLFPFKSILQQNKADPNSKENFKALAVSKCGKFLVATSTIKISKLSLLSSKTVKEKIYYLSQTHENHNNYHNNDKTNNKSFIFKILDVLDIKTESSEESIFFIYF